MIYPALNSIADALNEFMFNKWGATANGTSEIVQLNNIAAINDDKNDLQDKIIITLIKTEEESTLKNGPFYSMKDKMGVEKHHPAVYLNMYLLISITKKNYKEALQLLSDTVLFFQFNKSFKSKEAAEDLSCKILVDMYNIEMQEIFELWSNLGNKQFPFIIYKARVIKLLDKDHFKTASLIKSTSVTTARADKIN